MSRCVVIGAGAAAVLGSTSGLVARPAHHNLERAMTPPQILDRTPSGEPGPPPPGRTPVLLPFDNTYARLPGRFFARVRPTPVAAPRLVRLNEGLAGRLGLDPDWLAGPE